MKKVCFVLTVILVIFSVSACFPTPDSPSDELSAPAENSKNVSDTASSQDESDTSDVSEESGTELDLNSMTAAELVAYADSMLETIDSAKTSMVSDVYMTAAGQEQSFTTSTTKKVSGATTDETKVSITHTDPETGETATLYYDSGKGYYSSNAGRFSFDCDADSFDAFADQFTGTGNYFASPNTGEFEPDDTENLSEKLYKMFSVANEDDGGFVLTYIGSINDVEMLEGLFGMKKGEYNESTGVYLEYKIYIDQNGYLLNQTVKTEYEVSVGEISAKVSAVMTYEISDINKPVTITFPDVGFNHIGDIKGMFIRYCLEQLNKLDKYSTFAKQNYHISLPGMTDDVVVTREFIADKSDDVKFSYDFNASLRGTKYTVRQYFEDGVIYSQQNNQIQNRQIGEVNDDFILSYWVLVYPELSLGKDYSFTDNGDGTGTLTFTYTDETVTAMAEFMFASIYGESGLFTAANSVSVTKAAASITADLKTGVLISHKYDVEAAFTVQDSKVVFKESTEITAAADPKPVPDRTVFFAQGSF